MMDRIRLDTADSANDGLRTVHGDHSFESDHQEGCDVWGLGELNTYNTWTWDGTTWTQDTPATQPQNRYSSGCVFDPALNAVVIFGADRAA